MEEILKEIYAEYPILGQFPFKVIDSRGKKSPYGGVIEFYSPDEKYNPNPGTPTLEVFSKDLKGEELKKAIFGDMLHYLPEVDPVFSQVRDSFIGSLTPDQLAVDRAAYEKAKKENNEKRSFEDWFKISRQDAYLRGFLAPDRNNEWADAYTPEQTAVLQGLQQYLKQPVVTEPVSPFYTDPFGDTTK